MKQAKLLTRSLAAAAVTAAMASVPLMATAGELSASGGVANTYLFRGLDLGDGSAQVFGDITYTLDSGFYASAWISSGDDALGTEVDFIAGWGGEFGPIGVDINVTSYYYSDGGFDGVITDGLTFAEPLPAQDSTFSDLSEIILSLSYSITDDVSLSLGYVDNIAGATGFDYTTIGLSAGKFSFLVGQHSEELSTLTALAGEDVTHFDIGYAFNDNVSFTVSKVISGEEGDIGNLEDIPVVDDDAIFVFAYSLPIM